MNPHSHLDTWTPRCLSEKVECWSCKASIHEHDEICSECNAEQLCPSCGGNDLVNFHVETQHGECDGKLCQDCGHRWDIG